MGQVFKNLGRPDDIEIKEPVKWFCPVCKRELWSAETPVPMKLDESHECSFVRIESKVQKSET